MHNYTSRPYSPVVLDRLDQGRPLQRSGDVWDADHYGRSAWPLFIIHFSLFIITALGSFAQVTSTLALGDDRPDAYLPLLRGQRVALFSNHTGLTSDGRHVLDVLLAYGVDVVAIFSPEHGFRGTADAGEAVKGSVDVATGVPILSLYDGKRLRPSAEDMQRFDVLVADIQDVGLRFYTYHITLCRLMEACAEHGRRVVVLDRPNPNGHLTDGPLLEGKHKSGVGLLPIPVLHGMTIGELAQMANDEGWLERRCELTVVPCLGYTHQTPYDLPVPPSPNLPNMQAVHLYASLCLFEGTVVSLGRGTDLPFQVYGHPAMTGCDYSFTPQSRPGAKHPPHEGRLCHGVDLSTKSADSIASEGLNLEYLIHAYHNVGMGERFFTSFFEKLIGVDYVRRMIIEGHSAADIRACWRADVDRFVKQRRPYLLYE